MAKRNKATTRASKDTVMVDSSAATTADAIEQRLVAFAEQLGRVAGTVQAKADGWLDREALSAQVASVRDGAVDLLKQLAAGVMKASRKKKPAGAARAKAKGRSGGAVDAPGKKHRKRMPADPDATLASSQAAKIRVAKTMEKTSRRRGRG